MSPAPPLRIATDPRWLPLALARFDEVLLDHAHCEQKAAASAMALVAAYPERSTLVRRCTRLAVEELRHFRLVHERLVARGLVLDRDRGDPYARALLALARTGPLPRLVDRLLAAALIEARSHERLSLLAGALPDPGLATLYRSFATAEAGHHRLFVELAEEAAGAAATAKRLAELAEAEATIVAGLPLAARIH
jgi:tRNA-(ms[2]io[6]A)-hydroxylase